MSMDNDSLLKQERNKTAWFAVRVVVLSLGMNYVLGGLPTLLFLVGWWWGSKGSSYDREG
jgi:hypothetical protein